MFPSYKKEISSKTVGCFMLMTYSPSRCASSWLHAIITSPVIRPMAPALMFHPKTSITQFRDTALQIWSLWTIWCVWAFWQTRFMGTPTLQIFWIGKWWGTNFRNLTCLRSITHDITVINIIMCQVLHLRKTTHHPKTRVHKRPVTPALPIRLTWTCPPFMVFPIHVQRCAMILLTKLSKITTRHVIIVTVCNWCTTWHVITFFSSSLAVDALWHGPDNDKSGEKGGTQRNWPVPVKMANHHTKPQQHKQRRPANPPARLAFRLQSNKATRRMGPGPTKNNHKWVAVRYSDKSHCIKSKTCKKRINHY